MKASTRQQHLLIDLQDIDTSLIRLERRMKQLPEKVNLQKLEEELKQTRAEYFEKQKAVEDIEFEITRIESDVKLVQERMQRTSARLNASVAAKEATALQDELKILQNRANLLEDRELELMEEAEAAETVKNEHQNTLSKLENQHKELADAVTKAEKDAAAEKASLLTERAGLAAEIQSDLRELYEQTKQRYGIGAAKLIGKVSGGSNMELDAADLATVSKLPDDEIYFCPVSGVILVRGLTE